MDQPLRRLLKEPLLHFLLIGALLFGLYRLANPASSDGSERRIVVSAGRIDQLAGMFASTSQRPPTPTELKGLIDEYVLEEIYYRKAVAMGLDRDDAIIRQRLRDKLEFLLEDTGAPVEPTDADLRAYLAANAERFRTEGGLPELDAIRDVVAREWSRTQRLESNRKLHARLLDEYEVVIEWPSQTGTPHDPGGS